jgi:hypothetical protein
MKKGSILGTLSVNINHIMLAIIATEMCVNGIMSSAGYTVEAPDSIWYLLNAMWLALIWADYVKLRPLTTIYR